jgi:hypothetical protein
LSLVEKTYGRTAVTKLTEYGGAAAARPPSSARRTADTCACAGGGAVRAARGLGGGARGADRDAVDAT